MSVGESVEEAFYYIHNLVVACEIQVGDSHSNHSAVYLDVSGVHIDFFDTYRVGEESLSNLFAKDKLMDLGLDQEKCCFTD